MEVKRRKAKVLVAKLSSVSEQTRTESLCELRLISKNDPESRALISEAGAILYLSEILYWPSAVPKPKPSPPIAALLFTTHFRRNSSNLPPTAFPTLPVIGHLYLLKKPIYRTLTTISANERTI
ncbi:hypothetical protein L1987_60746 [Smallanthus sonchifolius]|uniref:Uncharacterized protein n=1 Tax=Smallanthus sonchifolius TaxID=185202 RepID=A0ACB9D8W3_9ASTR|nr:hypothetical protein L1987_60746 [Smallanthus sonchifolius]